jgi:hypothetical protein
LSVVDTACQALQQGRILELQYDGYSRCVEVHAVGTSTAGHQVMACWQTSGGSSGGEVIGWKLMRLDEVLRAAISSQASAAPCDGYRRGDKRMQRIIYEL